VAAASGAASARALDAVLASPAVSVEALQRAREKAEKKLQGVRRLMEENLREDLELQMKINRLEASIRRQMESVNEVQDLLNIELIRVAELGE